MTPAGFLTEPLRSDHGRSSFTCGHPALDRYLREQAGQDVRRRLAAVFVMPRAAADPTVVGYYTLSALAINAGSLPEPLRRRIAYREVPAALLGRLAVHRDHQGRGIGALLVVDAVHRCLQPASPASMAMVVDPVDDAAATWYRRLGFQHFPTDRDRLFAPLETLRRVLEP